LLKREGREEFQVVSAEPYTPMPVPSLKATEDPQQIAAEFPISLKDEAIDHDGVRPEPVVRFTVWKPEVLVEIP